MTTRGKTFTDNRGQLCEIANGRIYEIIDGERRIPGTADCIKANALREQAIADAQYIIEFSDRPEGMVHIWHCNLMAGQPMTLGIIDKLSKRAAEIQAQRAMEKGATE